MTTPRLRHSATIARASFERQRERLLAQDMLSSRRGGEDLIAVQLVGRGDVDGVHVLRFDQLFQARRRMRDSVLLCVTRRAVRVRAHDRDRFAAIGAEGADHVLGGDRACADQPPTKFRHQCVLALRAERPGRICESPKSSGQSTASGSKSPLARWRMRSWAAREPRSRGLTATLLKAGSVCLASSMSSKPMTAKSTPDRNARLHQRADEADRDDVVETKGGGRRLAEVEQLRNRRPAARVVGRRFDDERRIERNSGLFEGESIAGEPLLADQHRRHAADEGDTAVSVGDQMGGRLSRAFLVLRRDERGLQARKAAHHLDDGQPRKKGLQLARDAPIAGASTSPAAPCSRIERITCCWRTAFSAVLARKGI